MKKYFALALLLAGMSVDAHAVEAVAVKDATAIKDAIAAKAGPVDISKEIAAALSNGAMGKSMMMPTQCSQQDNVIVSVSYNFKAKSFAEAKKMFDDHQTKVAEYAKQQSITLNVQNQNFNINSQPTSYRPDGMPDSFTYQTNGNIGYKMANSDEAFKFAEFLSKQNIQVSLNSNSYRNGNCVQPLAHD